LLNGDNNVEEQIKLQRWYLLTRRPKRFSLNGSWEYIVEQKCAVY